MNRKGNVPTILLFLACLFLIVFSLFLFASFDSNFSDNSDEINKVLANADFYETYLAKESGAIARESILNRWGNEELSKFAEQKNLGIRGLENYFGKMKRGEFKYYWDGEKYWFEMSNVSISFEKGGNSIKRNFDIILEFDNKGERIRN